MCFNKSESNPRGAGLTEYYNLQLIKIFSFGIPGAYVTLVLEKSEISNPWNHRHVHFLTTGNFHISLTFSDTV